MSILLIITTTTIITIILTIIITLTAIMTLIFIVTLSKANLDCGLLARCSSACLVDPLYGTVLKQGRACLYRPMLA